MKLKARRELPEARIEIIPMIDVMLFLLVFFMLSSLSLARLNGLPVELPKTKSAPAQNAQIPTLTIQNGDQIFLNRAPLELENLAPALQKFRGQTLLINADERVSHGLVMRCMDAARLAGLTQFSLASLPQK